MNKLLIYDFMSPTLMGSILITTKGARHKLKELNPLQTIIVFTTDGIVHTVIYTQSTDNYLYAKSLL